MLKLSTITVTALALVIANVALADPMSGTIYYPKAEGIDATGGWQSGETSLAWDITQADGTVHYCYTANVPSGALSHFILQVSDGTEPDTDIFTSANIWNVQIDGQPSTNYSIGTWSSSQPSNPYMPDSIYGVKFDGLTTLNTSICFDSDRLPMDGSFYSKDGKADSQTGEFNAMWNTGLASGTAFIPVPDSKEIIRGSLEIWKFKDVDENGLRGNPGVEPTLAGWSFVVEGPGGSSTVVTTNSEGWVAVPDLVVGTYTVTEELPPPAGFENWYFTASSWVDEAMNTTTGGNPLIEIVVAEGELTRVFMGNNIPEAGTLALLLLGGVGAFFRSRRRHR